MSAAGRLKGGKAVQREELDAYYTPPELARTCVRLLQIPTGARILEPSVGSGSFLEAVRAETGILADAVDLMPEVREVLRPGYPTLTLHIQRFERFLVPSAYDLVVGNPPYKHAQEHVEHAHYVARHGGTVAMLLRLNFLAGQKRRAFYREYRPWRVYVLEERPDFTGGGGDATEYAFFVWKVGARVLDTVQRHFSWQDEAQAAVDVAEIRARDWLEAA